MGAYTEAEMLEDVAKRFCPNCGAAVTPNGRGRPRVFCSEDCRYAWKNRHPHPEKWKSTRLREPQKKLAREVCSG